MSNDGDVESTIKHSYVSDGDFHLVVEADIDGGTEFEVIRTIVPDDYSPAERRKRAWDDHPRTVECPDCETEVPVGNGVSVPSPKTVCPDCESFL